MPIDITSLTDDELRAHLHGETSKLHWSELERHFARGVLFKVAVGLDILDVAIAMSRDDQKQMKQWIDDKKVSGVEVDDAKIWHEQSASLWAVIVAPWILVQEPTDERKLDS